MYRHPSTKLAWWEPANLLMADSKDWVGIWGSSDSLRYSRPKRLWLAPKGIHKKFRLNCYSCYPWTITFDSEILTVFVAFTAPSFEYKTPLVGINGGILQSFGGGQHRLGRKLGHSQGHRHEFLQIYPLGHIGDPFKGYLHGMRIRDTSVMMTIRIMLTMHKRSIF